MYLKILKEVLRANEWLQPAPDAARGEAAVAAGSAAAMREGENEERCCHSSFCFSCKPAFHFYLLDSM